MSQDAVPESDGWLGRLVAPFKDPKVGGVYGRQIPPGDLGPRRSYTLECLYPLVSEVRQLDSSGASNLADVRFSNANSAVRSTVFQQFRFNEDAIVCEDHGLCHDILCGGFKVVYEAQAAVIHGHERSTWGEFGWAVDNGISLKRMGILGKSALRGEFRYGIGRVLDEFRHWVSHRRYACASMALVVSGVRWLGVQVGKQEHRLPSSWMIWLSPGLQREMRNGRKSVSSSHPT